jgi:hypothetical protein
MEIKARIGDEADRLDELIFESIPEPEPGPATGLILDSLRRRASTRTIR